MAVDRMDTKAKVGTRTTAAAAMAADRMDTKTKRAAAAMAADRMDTKTAGPGTAAPERVDTKAKKTRTTGAEQVKRKRQRLDSSPHECRRVRARWCYHRVAPRWVGWTY